MTPEQLQKISVIDPISPALEKVKIILFKPFDIGKWFVIGFCAWLAFLGQGGFSFNFRFKAPYVGQQPSFRTDQPFQWPEDFEPDEFTEQAKDFIQQAEDFAIDNLPWVILGGSILAIFIIALWLVFTWLSSRGKFMFLHCVALNKAEVKVPWQKFRRQGNSLFLFRVVVWLISCLFYALFIGVMVFLAVIAAGTHAYISVPVIAALILLSLLIIVPLAIAFILFWKFTNDFVVPIMYLRASTCTAAWRVFWTLLTSNKGRFTLYILFQIVIAIVIRVILIPLMCIACCCCCIACILSLPYIGTVALLPIFVFKRSYSLCYFRQYGPGFDVFVPEVETA